VLALLARHLTEELVTKELAKERILEKGPDGALGVFTIREEEIFTTAASAGFNTGAKPSAFGGTASTFFQLQGQQLATGMRTNVLSPQR
jgi:hypothetical protein